MNLTDRKKLIKGLRRNGYVKEKSPIGIDIYTKDFLEKRISFIFRISTSQKDIIQLTNYEVSREINRYTDVNNIKFD